MATAPVPASWLDISADSDFSMQNFPFGIFSTGGDPRPRAASALGNYAIDLAAMARLGLFQALSFPAHSVFSQPVLNEFMSQGRPAWRAVRSQLQRFFSADNRTVAGEKNLINQILIPLDQCTMHMPVQVGNYTDFYSSEQHATNVGTMFRDPKNALLPNWKHLPVAYHGRASSIILSGTPIRRPMGQTKPADAEMPVFGPSKLLDFELEMGFFIGKGNELGTSITTAQAEEHIFGFVVFNDWSARDVQTWEYVPLGPFLAKNFASSISPWIVTLDALEPFRVAGEKQDPAVLPYLQYQGNHHFDVKMEVLLQAPDQPEQVICHSNYKHLYWNICQQLAHHTVNGCNMRVGDLLASGTISGKTEESYGSMLELTWRGTKPIKLADGTERKFINDHDTLIMRAYAQRPGGPRVGFGEVRTQVLPAREQA